METTYKIFDHDIGDYNSGDGNIGSYNSGDRNIGSYNSGDDNKGGFNSGDCNIGYFNIGGCNIGGCNGGCFNLGDRNSGRFNLGDDNKGKGNNGDRNIGDHNTGSFNIGNGNNGCFNTNEPTIRMFNKPSCWTLNDWVGSRAYDLLREMPETSIWVETINMTDDEKRKNPSYSTTGGYLKIFDDKELIQLNSMWWKGLKDDEKSSIMSLPNFDKEIFMEITGIDVDAH